jgi:UDP-GlcNAc3NAcA epimerase
MMKVLTVVGARPQFIKAAPVSRALAASGCLEIIVHTGQHYDPSMSAVFFRGLGMDEPRHNLEVGSGSHGVQTGRMLEKLDELIRQERPDQVLVYGDTNSTVAGALAAVKLHVPVAHVEAGLRSFNRRMPEEINRVMTDHVSSLLFAPTDAAVEHLRREGITAGVIRTGDVMYDAVKLFEREIAATSADVLARHGLAPREYAFLTLHRSENTDDPERWNAIVEGIRRVAADGIPIVWAVHPRVRERAAALGGEGIERLILIEPQPYFETQALVAGSRVVITDSGGLQKEAAFHAVPCVTLRDETEWIELVEAGANVLAGTDPARIVEAVRGAQWLGGERLTAMFGDGATSRVIVEVMLQQGTA